MRCPNCNQDVEGKFAHYTHGMWYCFPLVERVAQVIKEDREAIMESEE